MANPEHLAKLKEGAYEWNTWRNSNPTVVPELSGAKLNSADLSAANLIGADLHMADLHGAALNEADLSGADLHEANLNSANLRWALLGKATLSGADFGGAELSEANLTWANLNGAILCGAYLHGANLTSARLSQANLNGASLSETVFGDINLKDVRGLNACVHFGPSILDHQTLAKSGPLPLAFLRGCGLPDDYIDYLPSLFNQAIQFYSCFISYSTNDQAFADRLYADLQNKGVRCWFAPHDIQGGKKIHEQIDNAIRVYDRLLLILSEASMRSEWVKTEIANARQKELGKGERVLFPISLVPFEAVRQWKNFDADTGKDSAREIREYFIPDFSDWKNHDNYQHAFERLLKDLKAEEQ